MLLKLISQGESDEGNGLRKLPGKKLIWKAVYTVRDNILRKPTKKSGWVSLEISRYTHVDTDLFVGYSIDNRRAALGRPFGKVLWQ
jgi:hypothetical protein